MQRLVREHLSLDLPARTVTALVGENGAGTSTLVTLLGRMYDPTAGEITLDGAPLAAFDLAALRQWLTAVFQDHATFSLTLADNIALADPAFARAQQRSVLLIGHRLSTVRWADRIAGWANGRLVECGSHAELLVAGGVYADLFTMQASRYRDDVERREPEVEP